MLCGTCIKEDSTTASSSLELNQYIGNSIRDLVVSLYVSYVV
jgi:hypothetical protein